jgi:hypothetical protein
MTLHRDKLLGAGSLHSIRHRPREVKPEQRSAAAAVWQSHGDHPEPTKWAPMITVHLRYEIDADKQADFAEYGRRWIHLVNKLGGTHHGYFLPSEGDSDEAFALFTFPSLAAYEQYRVAATEDPECVDAYRFATETKCIRRYERRFLSPLFE